MPKCQWLPIIKELSAIDIVIIVTILGSGIAFWVLQLLNNNHQSFVVYKDNEVYCQSSLYSNVKIPIDTLAVIEVKDGQVRFATSNCKNQICVKQGWSHGNTLLCAPNKIYVSFQGKKNEVFITY